VLPFVDQYRVVVDDPSGVARDDLSGDGILEGEDLGGPFGGRCALADPFRAVDRQRRSAPSDPPSETSPPRLALPSSGSADAFVARRTGARHHDDAVDQPGQHRRVRRPAATPICARFVPVSGTDRALIDDSPKRIATS